MWKSGLIIGAIVLVLVAVITLIIPACAPCIAILAGLLAGYLAGVFGQPLELNRAVKSGALAGAIGGIGAVLGGILGGLGNALIVGPDRAAAALPACGLPATSMSYSQYYAVTLGTPFCIGLMDVLLMAGLGALGALIWRHYANSRRPTTQVIAS